MNTGQDIAILIPCYNEALTIGQVVRDFRHYLPHAKVYVYDNNSTDQTIEKAQHAGAQVRLEPQQGKGNVVRRMFADIDADLYILVDGDATYEAKAALEGIRKLNSGPYDFVNIKRIHTQSEAYRFGHVFGNKLLTGLVRMFFKSTSDDMLSGYKIFTKRFVKSFPALSSGFEIETELLIHTLELKLPFGEIEAPYYARPEGSESKLKTYSDGIRIVKIILFFIKEEKPLFFFGIASLSLASISILLGMPIVITFLETGLVPRLPTAVMAVGIMLTAILSLMCGLILDSIARGRKEIKRFQYLNFTHKDT
jgi:glycosyltransferase involved in cell wall biosynthesis